MTEPHTLTGEEADRLARGQQLVILAVLVNIVVSLLSRWVLDPAPAFLLALAAFVMGVIGLRSMVIVLRYSMWLAFWLFVLLFIPFINLLVILRINGRATMALRDAGYRVGFFGVRRGANA